MAGTPGRLLHRASHSRCRPSNWPSGSSWAQRSCLRPSPWRQAACGCSQRACMHDARQHASASAWRRSVRRACRFDCTRARRRGAGVAVVAGAETIVPATAWPLTAIFSLGARCVMIGLVFSAADRISDGWSVRRTWAAALLVGTGLLLGAGAPARPSCPGPRGGCSSACSSWPPTRSCLRWDLSPLPLSVAVVVALGALAEGLSAPLPGRARRQHPRCCAGHGPGVARVQSVMPGICRELVRFRCGPAAG